MKKEVKIADYEKSTHQLMLALNLVGINCDYLTTDLIKNTVNVYLDKREKMDLKDAVEIKAAHYAKWDEYFEKNNIKEDVFNDEYLTSKEVSKLFKIALSNLQNLRQKGIVPFYKLEGKLLYKKSEIEKALKNG